MSELFADQLRIINSVFKNAIEPKTVHVDVPNIQANLLQHQKSMIHMMYAHYLRMTHGFIWGNQLIHGKVGIIADPAGTGKTLSILGFISLLKNTRSIFQNNALCQGDLEHESNSYFYSNHIRTVTDTSSTNLIIVPQNVYTQWKDEIQRSTSLTCFQIESRRVLRNNTTPTLLCGSDFVLTTNKLYRYVQEYALEKGIRWKHIFIDDAAGIHISSKEPAFAFDFLWLISSNWLGLLFRNIWLSPSNLLYIRDRFTLHRDCDDWLVRASEQGTHISTTINSSVFLKQYLPYTHPCRSTLVLMNSNQSLESSYTLPQPIQLSLECRQNYTLSTLAQTPVQLENSIKIPAILTSLGVRSYDISGLIIDYPEKECVIRCKVDDVCSICLDATINRTFATCCMNTFCGSCILRNTIISDTCPTCRSEINTDDMVFMPKPSDILGVSGETVILNRHETCIDYIKRHRNEPILIYTIFENTYYQLLPDLEKLGIETDRLSLPTIQRTLADFTSGRVKVLFASNLDIIRGLNLTKIQHLIFFYEMAFSEQQQLLVSSAQRLGRQNPLSVVQLRSERLHLE